MRNMMTNKVKDDCIMYNQEKCQCNALRKLYCEKENCGFYKSINEYHKDGSKRKYPLCEEAV